MTIPDFQAIKEDFIFFDDWEGRFSYLIDLGDTLPLIDEAKKTDEFIVRGCMSQVWVDLVVSTDDPPLIHFTADSDALIVKGLLALVSSMFNGKTAAEIISVDPKKEFADMGLDRHLTPSRQNGLFSVVKRIQSEAEAMS